MTQGYMAKDTSDVTQKEDLFTWHQIHLTPTDLDWLLRLHTPRVKSKKIIPENSFFLFLRGCSDYQDAFITDGKRLHLVSWGDIKSLPDSLKHPVGIETEVLKLYMKIGKNIGNIVDLYAGYIRGEKQFARMKFSRTEMLFSSPFGPHAHDVIVKNCSWLRLNTASTRSVVEKMKTETLSLHFDASVSYPHLEFIPENYSSGLKVPCDISNEWTGRPQFKVKLDTSFLRDATYMHLDDNILIGLQPFSTSQVTDISYDPVLVSSSDGTKTMVAVVMPIR